MKKKKKQLTYSTVKVPYKERGKVSDRVKKILPWVAGRSLIFEDNVVEESK